ncbi:uncharacterized protein K452DRAFT_241559 [Aplosporella prunicola CBS 121167]|uniref:Uncharacterized protein n=1 Tax=Aplosporella prunicola CBS 121167 TaxID=1176127 RepID=A0A6A6BRA8_9PEZI|nr:uncharacterized protein K452DRAFT_241559 [Aplosporella prunicola CBS 121167]KAF2146629.1 hypothetical protein K452DRAFT_241559 [Aplosporella prunicola CBS 121167]
MQHPYQCLQALDRVGSQTVSILLAASGHNLFSFNLENGSLLNTWSAETPSSASAAEDPVPEDGEGPPGKKRKIENQSGTPPSFVKLVSSDDGRYVVAVTGEDKCVRVFSVEPNGKIQQLSERSMPKRPCALAITPDGQTIVCGDKFGDVYALPLHYSPEDVAQVSPQTVTTGPEKTFVPSATNLTVHTGRNRKALEAQLKLSNQAKTKEPLKFAHEILLGHVSMLTDLVLVTLDQENPEQPGGSVAGLVKPRRYILTSDRDEHIRISRAQPQTHIIEGFCLGHQEFVSKMCVPTQEILISGGGDDQLFVWNWLDRRLLKKIPIRDALASVPDTGSFSGDGKRSVSIAISGIWALPKSGKKTRIVVACEGIPVLLDMDVGELQSAGDQVKVEAIPMAGNVLDVAAVGPSSMVVSLDNAHVPGSTRVQREAAAEGQRLEFWRRTAEGQWRAEAGQLEAANGQGGAEVRASSRDTLYGVSNLRKRGGGGGSED